jgi:probable LLM family oxidoreductase
MHLGVDSFVSQVTDPETGIIVGAADRMEQMLETIVRADEAGVDNFGVGEHHRAEFFDSAPAVILAAAAALTKRIRLHSAVAVLSADDPVRLFQSFATLDLISRGRAELIVGRGSFVEAFPLFGLDTADYGSLFEEKLDLLLKIRANTEVHWAGRHRAPLTGQGVYPRPLQDPLPIWVGVGGTPASFVRAGLLGLPLMVAIIGGAPARFRPLIDLYREAGRRAGHAEDQLQVGLHCIGLVGDSDQAAADAAFPGYAEMFTTIGRERGFPRVTRAAYDAMLEPSGAFLIGDPQTVATKILSVAQALGGIDRISLQMTNTRLAHQTLLHSVELLGTQVAPQVRAMSARPAAAAA